MPGNRYGTSDYPLTYTIANGATSTTMWSTNTIWYTYQPLGFQTTSQDQPSEHREPHPVFNHVRVAAESGEWRMTRFDEFVIKGAFFGFEAQDVARWLRGRGFRGDPGMDPRVSLVRRIFDSLDVKLEYNYAREDGVVGAALELDSIRECVLLKQRVHGDRSYGPLCGSIYEFSSDEDHRIVRRDSGIKVIVSKNGDSPLGNLNGRTRRDSMRLIVAVYGDTTS